MRDMQSQFSSACESGDIEQASNVNIERLERLISIGAGAGILLGLARSGSLTRLLGALFGAALIHRGITGHCEVYEALDRSLADEYVDDDEPAVSRQIDIASDDSFPASDPPAWTGAAAT